MTPRPFSTLYYDHLETRRPEEREQALMASLPGQVAHAQQYAPAYAELLRDVDASVICTRQALAQLPVVRKHELMARQKKMRRVDAFGGFVARHNTDAGAVGHQRVFASPGPIYEPEGRTPNYWRAARALHAAGMRAGELLHNTFSYHFTPAGAMMESGAHALGCTVFPAGVGQTDQQVQAMADLQPAGYVGTPSFLKIILERSRELGIALPSLKKALVSGEACPPSLRDWFSAQGLEVYQCYATADLGLIAYETSAREGLVLDEHVIVEIVRPGTGDPVAEGEVGEVVVTTFNRDYPLIRFGTGDLSAVLPGQCPTGRTQTRIQGWLGRADQTVKVRGMFVHPSQVADIISRHAEVLRARLVISGEMTQDQITLQVEVAHDIAAAGSSHPLNAALVQSIRDITKLRADTELLAPHHLPNDGKVIIDNRRFQ